MKLASLLRVLGGGYLAYLGVAGIRKAVSNFSPEPVPIVILTLALPIGALFVVIGIAMAGSPFQTWLTRRRPGR